jgi:hypothetical protein
MSDIKQTLAGAFDDEPPMTIDRAAIVKAGRRRVAFRRGYTTAAVLAAVAVVSGPIALGWGGSGVDAAGSPSTLVTTTGTSSPARGITLVSVWTATPDGAVMSAQTSNSSDKATSNGTAPPLTWEQLAKIATHPGFTF